METNLIKSVENLKSRAEYNLEKYPFLRKGQAYMKVLFELDQNLYFEWTAKPWDCFYDEKLCDTFLEKLESEWRKGK